MSKFTYSVKDSDGKTQKGIVEATSVKQATNLLHERGFYIINISVAITPFSLNFSRTGISFNDLVHFTRQLSTMITAGLTLVEALGILRQQLSKPTLTKLVTQIEDEVKGGKSLVESLEKNPKVFPPIYIALVRAGEATGKLDVILSRLADSLEKSNNFKSKVRGVLIYPTIVVSGMVIVSFIVMTVVVPRLTSLYKEFGVSLPLPTQILIAVSSLLLNYWLLIIIVVVGGIFALLRWQQTKLGKRVIAIVSLKMPIFGPLFKQATLVEVTRTLALLVDGGVPILTSLEIAQDATGNVLYKEAFIEAAKKVEKGFSLSEPLSRNQLFPPILSQMVSVGEQTGKLGDSLYKLSSYFEAEAESAIHTLTTALEPLIMVVLGLGVGFLVMAVLLPIYSLTSKF
ncbi:type II secretion system F family protein [Candidatus Gottesmanbacteria bacterium]|nr:type II secretion system F family protein [Candidatus Gottesmanbacteria bacterium]